MPHANVKNGHTNLQIIVLNTLIHNFFAEMTSFLEAMKPVRCNNTILLLLFQAMKHFK